MRFKYALNEWPPLAETIVLALQWLMLTVPIIIIIGKAVAAVHYPQPELQLVYLRKLFLVCGIVLLAQLAAGHRLPLIVGPASVLLTGIVANAAVDPGRIYFSILAGGAVIALLSAGGMLVRITALFTQRIIGIVLLLIAFTMLPTILHLITAGSGSFTQLAFAGALLAVLLAANGLLKGLLRSTIIVWALIIGSFAYHLLFAPVLSQPAVNPTLVLWEVTPVDMAIDPGVLVSFLFCFLALLANDIGSMQTTAQLLALSDIQARTRSGVIVTGLGNVLAGFLGVIGPVNFSLSTGVILATGCASRYTLVPAAAGIILLACVPGIIQLFSYIPTVVIGTLMLYMMCSQLAGGLGVLRESLLAYNLEIGTIIALPILVGTMTAFLPASAAQQIPELLRPLLANGFVVGVVTALILEHWHVLRRTD